MDAAGVVRMSTMQSSRSILHGGNRLALAGTASARREPFDFASLRSGRTVFQDEKKVRLPRRLIASSPLVHGRMFRLHGQTLPGWLPRQKTPFVLSVGGAAAEVKGRFLPETILDPPSDLEGNGR
jgi:hypothetical protein